MTDTAGATDVAGAAANEAPERPRAGRRRDPHCDEAIFSATLALLAEEGYAGITIEGVAARAGVGKATIYRRYPNKAQLVVEAVRHGACLSDYLPDTGDVRADLAAMLTMHLEVLRAETGPVLVAFAAERIRHPALDEEFNRSVIGTKRAHLRRLLASAMERGELPEGSDVDVLAEAGPALLWHHALNRLPLTDDLPQRIVDMILGPAPGRS